jgi:hypothetical protein
MTYVAPKDCVVYDFGKPKEKHVSSLWARLYALYSGGGLNFDGTAFLHRRINPKGEARLVVIDVRLVPTQESVQFAILFPHVLRPSSLFADPKESDASYSSLLPIAFHAPFAQPNTSQRIYFGEPDQQDSSHLTIKYEDRDGAHIIDGWLKSDDTITLEQRDPTPPPPSTPAPFPK